MTKYVGAVLFHDASRLYLIFDGQADAALRPLFATPQAARAWLQQGMPKISEPLGVADSDEAVELIIDVALEQSGDLKQAGSFASRASKSGMWLTGARSFLEMAYVNGATASRAY